MNGSNPVDSNNAVSRINSLSDQNSSRRQVRAFLSARLPRTGGVAAPIPERGNRLGPVVHALNNSFAGQSFTEAGFRSYLFNQAPIDPIYTNVSASNLEQISANPAYFVHALFPTDSPAPNSFTLTESLATLLSNNDAAKQRQLDNLDRILPFMGLERLNDSFCLVEDFDFSLDAPWLLTRNSRALIARVIRSLYLAGNGEQALQIRDIMLSVARRNPTVFSSAQMIGIATALEVGHPQIMAHRWRDEQAEQRAQHITERLDFSYSRPQFAVLDPSAIDSEQYLLTGDQYADFLLGHRFNSQSLDIQTLVENTDFFTGNPNSAVFRHLFPNHRIDERQAGEPVVTLDTVNVFAVNLFARQTHRLLAHKLLARFGIETEGSLASFVTDFDNQRWDWLEQSQQGRSQRALLIRLMQSLHLLSSERLARCIQHIVLTRLEASGLTFPELTNALSNLTPYSAQAAVTPSTIPSRPASLALDSDRKTEVAPVVQPVNPTGIAPNQPMPFVGTPFERYQAYMTSPLSNEHFQRYLSQPQMQGWNGALTAFFPLEERASINPDLPTLDAQMMAEISQNPAITSTQLLASEEVLAHHNVIVTNAGLLVANDDFNVKSSALFNPNPAALVPRAMTRMIRHFAMTNQMHYARRLQRFLIDQGLSSRASITSLVHWHLATEPDYYQKIQHFDYSRIRRGEITRQEARAYLNQVLLEIRAENYPQVQLALINEERTRQNKSIILPVVQPSATGIAPDAPFPFIGRPMERVSAYLRSSLNIEHINNFIESRNPAWPSVVTAAFPLRSADNDNLQLPMLDPETIALLCSKEGNIERIAQMAVLNAVIRLYHFRRQHNNIFQREEAFEVSLASTDLFNSAPNAIGPRIMTRIILHLAQTNRLELAQGLQAFLISEGVRINADTTVLAHWHFATDPGYEVYMAALNPARHGPQQIAINLQLVRQEILETDYANIHFGMALQLFRAENQQEFPSLQMPRQPDVRRVSPTTDFTFVGTNLQRFRAYLESHLFEEHLDNFVCTGRDGWQGTIAAAFPTFESSPDNPFVPLLDEEISAFFIRFQFDRPVAVAAAAEAAQNRLLNRILSRFNIRRQGNIFVAKPGFDPRASEVFNNNGGNVLLLVRIIRHLFNTHRITLARSLQTFLLSQAVNSNLAPTWRAHLQLSGSENYEKEIVSVGTDPAITTNKTKQLLQSIANRNYPQNQANLVQQEQASRPRLPRRRPRYQAAQPVLRHPQPRFQPEPSDLSSDEQS